MANPKFQIFLVAGACVFFGYAACTPDSGSGTGSGNQTAGSSGGQASGTANGAGPGAGAAPGNGASTGFTNSGFANGANTFSQNGGVGMKDMDASCRAVTQEPEQVIVYRDATVTDTITTYEPVALYIMMDRSSSMVGYLGTGDPESWNNASAAVSAFVNDPTSAGLDVGLAAFPPINVVPDDAGVQGDCQNGSDCGAPIVPIGPLPQNAQALIDGMAQAAPPALPIFPFLTPTECALKGMINHCKQHTANTGEQCVAILVTDGNPTQCSGSEIPPNYTGLVNIVTQGAADGVMTFTLGLPGSNIQFLNQLAQAGGTDCDPGPNFACDLTSGNSQQAFLDALNSIRDSVTETTTTQVVTQEVISTPLDCQWGIPAPPDDQVFNPEKVNLQFTPAGAPPQTFGYVPSEADCAGAADAWYFDNAMMPTEVFVCPQACEVVKNSPGARVDIQLGCDRIERVPE